MNQPSFIGSSFIEDLENIVEVLWKFFEILHFFKVETVGQVAYQIKCVTRICFGKWKKNRVKDALILSWNVFESDFTGRFLPHESREERIRENITLKLESIILVSIVLSSHCFLIIFRRWLLIRGVE